jgi:starch-binding outer membrane protein, SusD/RagB family
LWAWNYGLAAFNNTIHTQLINGVFMANATGTTGECPTQNMVDKFETSWGDPLNTEADRLNAISLGHYNEQTPYANRDPRFYLVILYNTAPIPGYVTAKIFYEMVNGTPVYSELLNPGFAGITSTGYYQRKIWGEQSTLNRVNVHYTDPLIRLTELYLNYAEAANEAYGPNTNASGASMSAVGAINKIRARVGMVPVHNNYTSTTDVFRDRIKNERTVELYGEGHHYWDIRRWKDAPVVMSTPLTGMDIEKVPVSSTYPTGFKYTRKILPANRQGVWKSDAQYYFPFPIDEANKMKNFEPNARW